MSIKNYSYDTKQVVEMAEKILKLCPVAEIESDGTFQQYLIFAHALSLSSEMAFDLLRGMTDDSQMAENAIETIVSGVQQQMSYMRKSQ